MGRRGVDELKRLLFAFLLTFLASGLISITSVSYAAPYVKITEVTSPYTGNQFILGTQYTFTVIVEHGDIPMGSASSGKVKGSWIGIVVSERGATGYLDYSLSVGVGDGTTSGQLHIPLTQVGHRVFTIKTSWMTEVFGVSPDEWPVSDTQDLVLDVYEPKITLKVDAPDEVAYGEGIRVKTDLFYSDVPPRSALSLLLCEADDVYFKEPGKVATDGGGRWTQRYEEEAAPGGIGMKGSISHTFQVGTFWEPQEQSVNMVVIAYYDYAGAKWDMGFTTFSVNNAGSQDVTITGIDSVKPPDMIQVGENTPITVSIEYSNLYEGKEFNVEILDLTSGSTVGVSPKSPTLSGNGHYTFPPITVTPHYAGEWRLRAEIHNYVHKDFTIQVASTLEQVKFTKIDYVKPPDTILVGESTPVVASIQYSDLVPGTALLFEIVDTERDEVEGDPQTAKIDQGGSGTYTFKPYYINPLYDGDWSLKAIITGMAAGEYVELASKKFTISVEPSEDAMKVTITELDYVKPPSTVPTGAYTPISVTIRYKNLVKNVETGTELVASVVDQKKGAVLGKAPSTPLPESGTYTFPDINVIPAKTGEWNLQVVIKYGTLERRELASESIVLQVTASQESTQIQITKAEYVKPPDTIAIGEKTTIKVTVKYQNLPPSSEIEPYITEKGSATPISRLLGPSPMSKFSGSGTETFSLEVTPTKPGDWNLVIYAVSATKEITIKVDAPSGSIQAAITSITHVKPPDTVMVGESTPVTVKIQYQNAAPDTPLRLKIYDNDANTEIGSADAPSLSGSGKYAFPSLPIKPARAGDWHLEARLTSAGIVARQAFTIKVVAAAQGEATVRVTNIKYAMPPDAILVGESTPVTVAVQYQNLPPGTQLTAYIYDADTPKKKVVGSVTSVALSGSGTYTLPNIVIKPTRAGPWHLVVGVQGHKESQTTITINVEE